MKGVSIQRYAIFLVLMKKKSTSEIGSNSHCILQQTNDFLDGIITNVDCMKTPLEQDQNYISIKLYFALNKKQKCKLALI